MYAIRSYYVQKLTKDTKGNAGNLLGKVRQSKDKVSGQIDQLQEIEKQIAKKLQEEKAALKEAEAVKAAETAKAAADTAPKAEKAAKQKQPETKSAEKAPEKPPRITSYNVCYTKLLWSKIDFSAPAIISPVAFRR